MNIERNALASFLVQLGEATPEIEEIVQHAEESSWAIALEGDIVVTADLVADGARLCLCADLGRPHEQQRVAIWEAMLLNASLRYSNGGLSMALAEPDGECQILCDVGVDMTNLYALQTALLRFTEQARLWRLVVAHGMQLARMSPASAEILHVDRRA